MLIDFMIQVCHYCNKHMLNEVKTIFFDLDGTLYRMKGGSYDKSPLRRLVLKNATYFISLRLDKSREDANRLLNLVLMKYGEDISLGLEKELNLNRQDYFDTVWDIPAQPIVEKERNLRKNLLKLSESYRLVLVSDAPLIWVTNVLVELGIYDIFRDCIFSGESDIRKGFRTAFPSIMKSLNIKPANCVSVGDQEYSDILPAKKLGIKTIFINRKKKSDLADYNIKSIGELRKLLLG